jgi:hypothetical protein
MDSQVVSESSVPPSTPALFNKLFLRQISLSLQLTDVSYFKCNTYFITYFFLYLSNRAYGTEFLTLPFLPYPCLSATVYHWFLQYFASSLQGL